MKEVLIHGLTEDQRDDDDEEEIDKILGIVWDMKRGIAYPWQWWRKSSHQEPQHLGKWFNSKRRYTIH